MLKLLNRSFFSFNIPTPLYLAITFTIWLAAVLNQAYFQGVFEVSEGREGIVINEIKEFGTWLLPLRHGEVVPSKPPLFHWLTNLLSYQINPLSQFYLRTTSIISAVFCLLLVYYFLITNTKNKTIATNAILILSSSFGFLQIATDGRVDMLFTFFFLASTLLFNQFITKNLSEAPNKKLKIIIGLILGFGILTRGPLALVLFFLCYIVGLFTYKKLSLLKNWTFSNYTPLITIPCLISLPWYISSHFLGKSELISRQLIFENITRFIGGAQINEKPIWFYLIHIWSQGTVWVLFLLVILVVQIKQRKKILDLTKLKMANLFALQTFIIILFLSISAGKRRAYLLQILPLISIYIAIALSYLDLTQFSKYNDKILALLKKLSLFFLILACLELITKLIPLTILSNHYYFLALKNLTPYALIIPVLVSIVIYILFNNIKSLNSSNLILSIWFILLQTNMTLVSFHYLIKGESHSLKKVAYDIQSIVLKDDLSVIKSKEDESFDTLFFYYGKRIKLKTPGTPLEKGYYITRESNLKTLQSENPNLNLATLYTGKKLSDKDEKNIVLLKLNNPE